MKLNYDLDMSKRVWLIGRLNEDIINFAKSLMIDYKQIYSKEFEHNSLYLFELK